MLHIRLFGKIEITGDGTPADRSITLPRASRALAANLLLNGSEPCQRDSLAEKLWPDDPASTALANLRRHVHILVRTLSRFGVSDAIVANRSSVSWRRHEAVHVDVDAFLHSVKKPEHVLDAIRIYRDDLATDIGDSWIVAYRTAFRETFVDACLAGAKHYALQQDPRLSLQILTACFAFEPYREDIARALVLVCARTGDLARALQLGEQFVRSLHLDLAVTPSPAFREMLTDLRRGTFADPFPPDSAFSALSAGAAAPAHRLSSYSFRGRDPLLAELIDRFSAAEHGGSSVLLLGETGIGKSRFAREFRAVSEQLHIDVHLIGCDASTQRLPFRALTDIIDRLDLAHVARSGKRHAAAIRRAISARRHVDGELSSTAVADIALSLRNLLLLASNSKPVVVCIDDAEFADSISLEIIALMRALPGTAIGVLAIATSEARPQGRAWPATLFANSEPPQRLTPLAGDDIMGIIQEILQDETLQQRYGRSIANAAMGNPLFAQELARYCMLRQTEANIVKALPASMSSVVYRRLGELSPAELRMLGVCAAIGTTFELAFAGRIADATLDQVRGVVRRARGLDIVETDDLNDVASFRHGLFQDAILARMPEIERRALHARIACGMMDVPENQETIGYNWERAGNFDEAAEHYYAAAEYARTRLATDDSLALYDQAADLAEPTSRLQRSIRLGRAYALYARGSIRESRRLAETLLHEIEADANTDAVFQSKLLFHLSSCDWALLQRRNAVMWAQRSLEAIGSREDAAYERAAARGMLAAAAVLRGDAHEALDHLGTIAFNDSSDVSIKSRSYRSLALGMLGDQDGALECIASEAADFSEADVSIPTLALFRQNQGIVLGWFGRLAPARKAFEGVIAAAARAANPLIEATGYIGLGHLEYYADNLQLARFCYDAAAKRLPPHQGLHVAQLYCDALGLKLAAATGDGAAAAALVTEEHFVLCEGLEDILLFNTLTGALIDYCVAFGERPRARMLLKAYLTKLRVGAGLYYVLQSLLDVGDSADLRTAAALADAWGHGGANPMGECISHLIAAAIEHRRNHPAAAQAAAIASLPGFEKAGLDVFARAAEQFANAGSGPVAL